MTSTPTGSGADRCDVWPDKRLYATADEASVALREVADRYGDAWDAECVPFPCGDHYHHGVPEEVWRRRRRGPGRADRPWLSRPPRRA